MVSREALIGVIRSGILGSTAEDLLLALDVSRPTALGDLQAAFAGVDPERLREHLDLLAAMDLARLLPQGVALTDAGAELAAVLRVDFGADDDRRNEVLTSLLGWVETAPRKSLADFVDAEGASLPGGDISLLDITRAVGFVVRHRLVAVPGRRRPEGQAVILTQKGRLALHSPVSVTAYVRRVGQFDTFWRDGSD